MKKSIDTIGNRTRDLPACSAVPQPTAPPSAPPPKLNVLSQMSLTSASTVGYARTNDPTTNTDATTNDFYASIMESSIIVFTRERLFMLFTCVRLFMLFIRESLFIVFTKECLFMLYKLTCTVLRWFIHVVFEIYN